MDRVYRLKKIASLGIEIEKTKGVRILIPELQVSKNLQYHVDNNIKLASNVFRIHSDSFYDIFNEARKLWKQGSIEVCEEDAWLLSTDIGKKAFLDGAWVPLDVPMEVDDDEAIQFKSAAKKDRVGRLNSPRRIGKGDPGYGRKKFIVHVKNPATGNVKTITFGDANLSVKANNPERRKSFLARHNCDNPGPKTGARYWSCNLHRYKKQLGLKFEGRW
jgi:hypothetical protein